MRTRARITALLMTASALAVCNSPARDVLTLPTAPTSTVPIGSDFTLAPGESVVVNNGGFTLTFTGVVGDSRCPTNATIQCVWVGSATVAIHVDKGGTNSDITLESVDARRSVSINNYLVQLIDVTPAPVTLDSIPSASYRAILRISRP